MRLGCGRHNVASRASSGLKFETCAGQSFLKCIESGTTRPYEKNLGKPGAERPYVFPIWTE